ncbi:MAG: hypothetical protein KIT70_09260 [Anaerolineales bacterium]|nr:MAG: hypothetical protein KIT70_09260 [Anaerolineales bacterium]
MFAFYLFLLSGLALITFYGSAGEAVNSLVKLQLDTGFANDERFASALGLAASAGLFWLFHWRAYRGRLRRLGAGMQGLTLVYLFATAFGFALWAMFQAASVVELGTGLLMGLESASAWELAGQAAKLALTVALWVEHLRLFFTEANRDTTRKAAEATQA